MFAMGGVIKLPYPHKALWPNGRAHHFAKAREVKKHREWARLATLAEKIRVPSEGSIKVYATFRPKPSGPLPDADNAIASLKPSFDGIAEALGINDQRFIPQPVSFGPRIKGGSVSIRLEVEG